MRGLIIALRGGTLGRSIGGCSGATAVFSGPRRLPHQCGRTTSSGLLVIYSTVGDGPRSHTHTSGGSCDHTRYTDAKCAQRISSVYDAAAIMEESSPTFRAHMAFGIACEMPSGTGRTKLHSLQRLAYCLITL
nr:hypothetical protein CFP56_20300 [Quercus suber]